MTPAEEPLPRSAELGIGARSLARLRAAFALVLVVLAAGHAVWAVTGRSGLAFLDLGQEQSVGTWVTSVLHLASGLLSGAAAVLAHRAGSRWARNWWLLAVAFAFMSMDEVAALHDRTLGPLRELLGTGGVLYYAWVIPAFLVGAVFLAVQVGFLRHLGSPTGRDLVLAGVVFVTGAGGLEMAEGLLASQDQQGSAVFGVLILIEELMELGAIMWVVCILLRHLTQELDGAQQAFTSSTPQPVATGSSRRRHTAAT